MALADSKGVKMTDNPNSGGWIYDNASRKFVPREERLRSLLYESLKAFTPEERKYVDDLLDNPPEPEALEEAPFTVMDFIESVKNMPEDAKVAYMSYVNPLLARTPKGELPTPQQVHEAHNARVEELTELLAREDILFDAKKRQEVVDELDILSPPVEAKAKGAP